MRSLLCVVLLLCVSLPAFSADIREWTDEGGRKIQAAMITVKSGNVLLRLENGREVTFPIAKLSEADQAFVRRNGSGTIDSASHRIDELVFLKLKEENLKLKEQKQKVAADRSLSAEDRKAELEKLTFQESLTLPTPALSENQFVRRIYLDIAGRIPTHAESVAFLESRDPNKRPQLIRDLLQSEAFVSHFFNYLSDLLRVRDRITESMNSPVMYVKSRAYVDWVKDQIRENAPWNEVVSELIAAEGYYWENPAVAYLATDYGMELCNLSNTFTIFVGTEITCAQCHDHPFEEVSQMDFYRLASFFGRLEYQNYDEVQDDKISNRFLKIRDIEGISGSTAADLMQIEEGFALKLGDGPENKIRLPHDYKYDDGEPLQEVEPATFFGDVVHLEAAISPRQSFAEWLTSKDNPRFTINLVNRLWKYVFGVAQVEPVYNVPGELSRQAQNYELLKYLEELMKDMDYDIQAFLHILYNTKTYQREACRDLPTLEMISKGEFHFPAPLIRRLSAEQMWDSLVTLATQEPEANEVRILEKYQEIMSYDWETLTEDKAFEIIETYEEQMGKNRMMYDISMMMYGDKVVTEDLTRRASEQDLPAETGTFLHLFGQSDKRFIENSTREGSIPQVMKLMNGRVMNELVVSEDRAIVRNAAAAGGHDDGIRYCFLSILSRKPTAFELTYADQLVMGSENNPDYSDLIWALLNLHEFRFIQ